MNATVLYDHFDAENYTVPLTLTSEAPTSVLLGTAPANVTPPPTQRVAVCITFSIFFCGSLTLGQ